MGTVSTDTSKCQVLTRDSGEVSALRSDVTLIGHDQELIRTVAKNLTGNASFAQRSIRSPISPSCIVVYFPLLRHRGMVPDLTEADTVLTNCAAAGVKRFVLISSASVYDASFRNPGLMLESNPLPKNRKQAAISSVWRKLETTVERHFEDGEQLTILRCATLPFRESPNCIARSLARPFATVIAGHDPTLQLLSTVDLARAIDCVLKTNAQGVFNVAPDGVLPLRQALKRAGARRLPMPRTILALTDLFRPRESGTHLDFKRYSWTVSNEKIKALGFKPCFTSALALSEFCSHAGNIDRSDHRAQSEQFDDFGMDPDYIALFGRTLFRFLSDWYWRIEIAGIENIPKRGRGLLAGTHRGFMPWDGVMALHLIVRYLGRYPRFLIHPGLVKFPFLANFMTKLGGIIACQKNAGHVLDRNELLGVFPEGIRGAFVRYSQAYRIHDFHRDAFVRIALRHQAPIIPFVTVGSAEIFPIFAQIKSRLWTRYTEWPIFPITPTFPFIPLPLPSKWHMRFLPAIHLEKQYPPSAAEDTSVVRAISREVKERMQEAMCEILRRRRSIFRGLVF